MVDEPEQGEESAADALVWLGRTHWPFVFVSGSDWAVMIARHRPLALTVVSALHSLLTACLDWPLAG